MSRVRSRAAAAKAVTSESSSWSGVVSSVQRAHEQSSAIEETAATAASLGPEDGDLETVRDLDDLQAAISRAIEQYEAERNIRASESSHLKDAQGSVNSLLATKAASASSAGGSTTGGSASDELPLAAAGPTTGATMASRHAKKFKPKLGSQVAFRLSGQQRNSGEEEWIQCEVTKVFSDGQRYEVRDPEPDEHNNPGQSYRTNIGDLIVIPEKADEASLWPYPPGTIVLARYPETTTFYRAEVISTRRDGKCRLKFEEEEEEGKETEVERRLVLPLSR